MIFAVAWALNNIYLSILSPPKRTHGDSAKVTKCLWNMVNDTYLNLSHYLQCLTSFWRSCHDARVRIFKVIRLPLRALFGLAGKFPDLALVYLVRDPRAVLASQGALFGHAPRPDSFCRMVLDDARHMRLLQERFPGRAVAVRYEDISGDPAEWTRRLYGALRLELTPEVAAAVRRMTSASKGQEGAYTSFRADPRRAASRWRAGVDWGWVREGDRACREAYAWLGYRPAASEALLRNRSVSLTGPAGRLSLL